MSKRIRDFDTSRHAARYARRSGKMAAEVVDFSLATIKRMKLPQIREHLPNIIFFNLSRSALEVILYELKGIVLTSYSVSDD